MNGSIMLFMPKLYYGGAETQFRYFIEQCNKKKQKLYVIIENKDNISDFSNKNKNVVFYQLNLNFLEYIEKPGIKSLLWKVRDYFQALFKIISFLIRHRDIRYSIIYVGLGLKLVWIFKLFKIKVLFSERSSGELICKKWLNRMGIYFSDILCANSASGQKYIANLTDRNVELIHNGVKINDIGIKQRDNNTYIILVSARISKIKNIKGVIEALNILNGFGKVNFKAYFCGIVEDKDYYTEILDLVEKYNLKQKIDFLGYVKNIRDYYKKADLTILASFSEGTPNAILESFASRTMVIASNIEMNIAVMREKKYTFNPNDYTEMAQKIKEVMDTPYERIESIVENNYLYVKKMFGIDKMVDSYLSLLDNI